MDQLGISLLPSDDELALKFEGRPRFEAAAFLKQELLNAELHTNVTLDWERAEHIDACILQVLLALQRDLTQRGLSLMVKNDNPQVREYLQLSGLSSYFPLLQASEVVVQRGA